MANFIYNLLEIDTDPMILERIRYVFVDSKGVDAPTLVLNNIIPQPPELLFKQKKKTIGKDLIDWRIKNWGTHAETVNVAPDCLGDDSIIYFRTVLAAPIPALTRLSELCKDVKFTLYSSSDDIGENAFVVTLLNGVIGDVETYSHNDDAYRIYLKVLNLTVHDVDGLEVDETGKLIYVGEDDNE